MIKFIYGNNGSGKTSEVIRLLKEDAVNGSPSLLLVPEQEAVQAERLTLKELPPSAQLTLEVLSFSRLYNRVCREYGGLSYSYATKPIKHLMMWRALRQCAADLTEFGENALGDHSFAGTMLNAVSELKSCGITEQTLEDTLSASTDASKALRSKLADVCLILATYNALISRKYTDSSDDLSRLYDKLCEHHFFKGKNVYIDSFTSFTAVEHRIIERIFCDADNVTVTVPLPSQSYSDISTATINASVDILNKNAARWGKRSALKLGMDAEPDRNAIEFLRDELWNLNAESTSAPSPDGVLTVEICDNSYAEAEAVASHILALVRNGARYGDIVVIMRDAQAYRGIIEPAFENAGIPFYFSEKTPLCSLPPIKLLLGALRIRRYNWRKDDVISLLKTGLCGFSERDVDLFEEYVNTWHITGENNYEKYWSMNPDGYESEISERGEQIRLSANAVRASLHETLTRFFVILDASNTMADACRTIYSFLVELELDNKLSALSERERKWGNLKAAEELSSAWGVILQALADVGEALSDVRYDLEDLSEALRTVFDNTDVGTIPTSIDEVTVGSASMMRSANPSYAFVMGLCEGEFPAAVDDKGIFTESDRSALSKLGVELSGNGEQRFSEELMYVKNAFSAPTKKLFLLSSTHNTKGDKRVVSLPLRRVTALFGDSLPFHKFKGNDLSYLSGSPRSAASHLRTISDASAREAALESVSKYIPSIRSLISTSATTEECRIDPDVVRSLIGNKLSVSPSSIEKYVKCPFSYFVENRLYLRDAKQGRFKSNNFGTFVHHVLQHMIRFALPTDIGQEPPSREEILAQTERVVEDYVRSITPEFDVDSKKLRHLYQKLTRLSSLLIDNILDEFADSSFRPAFFELQTNGCDGAPSPMNISLGDGRCISLSGYVDRVDVWKNNDAVYVRIIDYKTGAKEFDLRDVEVGLNTQMLLYLFSICANPGQRFIEQTGLDADSYPIPAGITYLSSSIPKIQLKNYDVDAQEILSESAQRLSRSGIILDNEDIINATSASRSSDRLLGITEKDGKFVGKALINEERFEELKNNIVDTLTEIGNKIYSGIADRSPIERADIDPCKFCSAGPLCRRNDYK